MNATDRYIEALIRAHDMIQLSEAEDRRARRIDTVLATVCALGIAAMIGIALFPELLP